MAKLENTLQLTLSAEMYAALVALSRTGFHGNNETEVAGELLRIALREQREWFECADVDDARNSNPIRLSDGQVAELRGRHIMGGIISEPFKLHIVRGMAA